MLVHSVLGRLYTLIARLISDSIAALPGDLYAIQNGNTSLLEDLLDRLYLHSKFCQRHFNFRLNYHQYARGESSELQHTQAKCGITHEEHSDITKHSHTAVYTSGVGHQMDLCKLSIRTVRSKHTQSRAVVVLVPGILQSSDVFIYGGKESLAFHLLSAGYSVWIMNVPRNLLRPTQSNSATTTAGQPVDPQAQSTRIDVSGATSYQYTADDFIAVARYIQHHTHRDSAHPGSAGDVGVCWVAHSTACNDLLVALSGNRESTTDNIMNTSTNDTANLRHLTRSVVLLSPLLTLSHLHPHSRRKYASKRGTKYSYTHAGIFPSLMLHELLLCHPQYTYGMFGAPRMLTSLQLWRDLLQPSTYTYYMCILCKYTLGWKHFNISPQRRSELLPHLFSPTSTEALVTLLYASTRGVYVSAGIVSVCGNNIRAFVRWLLSCTCITLDVVSYVVRCLLRVPTAGTDRTSKDACMQRTVDTTFIDHNANNSNTGKRSALNMSSRCDRTTPTVVVGGQDALCGRGEVEQRLHQLDEHCAFHEDVHVVAGYEHMDTLWADDAGAVVFPVVVDSLAHSIS